jgi:hypothetical protein
MMVSRPVAIAVLSFAGTVLVSVGGPFGSVWLTILGAAVTGVGVLFVTLEGAGERSAAPGYNPILAGLLCASLAYVYTNLQSFGVGMGLGNAGIRAPGDDFMLLFPRIMYGVFVAALPVFFAMGVFLSTQTRRVFVALLWAFGFYTLYIVADSIVGMVAGIPLLADLPVLIRSLWNALSLFALAVTIGAYGKVMFVRFLRVRS